MIAFSRDSPGRGQTWDLFSYCLFSLKSSALDHSATGHPPPLCPDCFCPDLSADPRGVGAVDRSRAARAVRDDRARNGAHKPDAGRSTKARIRGTSVSDHAMQDR